MTMTSTQFLAAVKRLITAPSNQSLLTNDDFLEIADRKTLDSVLPVIDALNGEFFVTTADQAITADTAEYPLPSRALARKLRDVKLKNSADIRFDCPKISIEREQLYQISGVPFGFYFKGDRFTVVPTPSTSDYTIQYWYFLPPNSLCAVSEAALVTGVSGDDVTVSAVPTTIVVGSVVDFIQGTQGNSCLGIDKTITNISSTTITFATGDVPTDLAAGDYISLAGTSPLVQLPDVAIPYLVTLTAMEAVQAYSDFEGYERLNAIAHGDDKYPGQLKNLKQILEPRIEGEATKIINDFGLVRRRAGGPWRGYYQY